jgi:acyl carrier protein
VPSVGILDEFMTVPSSAEKLEAAFRNGLALSNRVDVRTVQYDVTRQWDSVAHLLLVVSIEDAFGIHLAPADVIELSSYPTAVSILKAHGVWVDA